jgi:UDP-N-acetylmuramoyl-L-alanyl-D-glutamate--2,6-diaminopimelate ligase
VKVLKDILYKAGITEVIGDTETPIMGVTADSRAVELVSLFVAVRGTISDGHKFIDKAIEGGAIAIVCEELPAELNPAITYIRVHDASYALGHIASNFYGVPSSRMRLVGVTGTNGKTTCATLLYNLFTNLGHKCGLISTVENKIGREVIPSTHTTPDPVSLNKLLADMADENCTYAFMEVSSHAAAQNRITGLEFIGAVFTNLTLDHLDYHKTLENYRDAKKKFFDQMPYGSFALVNNDDRNGMFMMQNTKAKRYTYGLKNMADYKAKVLEDSLTGLHLIIDGQEFWTKLIGNFNAYNLLAVYSTAILLGESKVDVLTALSALSPPEGRFQYIKSKSNVAAIVDYAHTPDALENVLKTIEEIRTRNEQVITIVGCGGDRDRSKRPLMAQIACEHSDRVILTSDNPRSENPEDILAEMQTGVDPSNYKKVLKVTDRKEAIRTAISLAKDGDIILVAGKGHEKYQEIQGVKYPFDDMEVIKETFNQLEN